MKTHTLLVALLFVSQAFALEIAVNNLNIGMINGKGRITTDEVKFVDEFGSFKIERNDLEINRIENDMVINHKDATAEVTVYKVDAQANGLKDLKEVTIINSNLKMSESLDLWATKLSVLFGNDQLDLETVSFSCPNLQADLINACLNNSNASIVEAKLPASITDSIAKDILQITDEKEIAAIKLKNFLIGFDKQHFAGSFDINIIFDVEFTFSGDLGLDEKNKRIVITNFEIKRGIIPMTGLALEALKRANIKGLVVDGDVIYIQLN